MCVNCAEFHYDNSTHTWTTWGSNSHLLYVPLAHPLLSHNPDDPLAVSMPQPRHSTDERRCQTGLSPPVPTFLSVTWFHSSSFQCVRLYECMCVHVCTCVRFLWTRFAFRGLTVAEEDSYHKQRHWELLQDGSLIQPPSPLAVSCPLHASIGSLGSDFILCSRHFGVQVSCTTDSSLYDHHLVLQPKPVKAS